MTFAIKTLLRLSLAMVVGILIGSERERHGRAAGMRTHILVCLGATLTSLVGVYTVEILGITTDISRLSAQVISGIGFLGAGMIILKNNNVVTGLTTAAGVWTTSIIGIAIGFGFYIGALACTVLFLAAVMLFTKFERRKKRIGVLYLELDDMYRLNETIAKIHEFLGYEASHRVLAPKSGFIGHIGVHVLIDKRKKANLLALCQIETVVFMEEEE